MLGFIYSNQTILTVLGVILILVVAYFAVKKLPTKVTKKTVKEEKKEEVAQKKEEVTEKKDESESESEPDVTGIDESLEKIEESEKEEDEKDKKKPKIVQIFKRRESEENKSQSDKRDLDPIYNRNVEFVNTSKNIAKFKSFADDVQPNIDEQTETDDFGFVVDKGESCELCEDKVKHFSHTKRLSSIVNDGDFFDSHLSEKYLTVNPERHLELSKLESDLYERAETMLKNSEKHVQCECHNDEEHCCHDDCECEDEDYEDVKIDMKTALISETYFNRKRKRSVK